MIFGGKVVAEVAAAEADEPALLRAAYNLKADATMPELLAAELVAEATSDATVADESPASAEAPEQEARDQ